MPDRTGIEIYAFRQVQDGNNEQSKREPQREVVAVIHIGDIWRYKSRYGKGYSYYVITGDEYVLSTYAPHRIKLYNFATGAEESISSFAFTGNNHLWTPVG